MTSTILPTGEETYSLAHEAELVRRFPNGSRQKLVGTLWVKWLEHIHRCQQESVGTPGCPRRYSNVIQFEDSYPDWNCCVTHTVLHEERRQLVRDATQLDRMLGIPPHHTGEVLTRPWWTQHGHVYIPHLPVQV